MNKNHGCDYTSSFIYLFNIICRFTFEQCLTSTVLTNTVSQTKKNISFSRLDQILGKSGSKNKDVYESKVSLASRVVKVERQVSKIFFFFKFKNLK